MLLFSNVGFAELYQWKDSAGQVHYTDDPTDVPSQEKSIVKLDIPQTINSTPAMSTREAILERQEQNTYMAQQKQQLVNRELNMVKQCKVGAARLEQMKTFGRITTYKEDGSIYYLTEQERSAYIEKEIADYQKTCGNL